MIYVITVIFTLIMLVFIYLLIYAPDYFSGGTISKENEERINSHNIEERNVTYIEDDIYKRKLKPILINHNINYIRQIVKQIYEDIFIYFKYDFSDEYIYLEWNSNVLSDKTILFNINNEKSLNIILSTIDEIYKAKNSIVYKVIIYYALSDNEYTLRKLIKDKNIDFYIREPFLNYYLDINTCFYDIKTPFVYKAIFNNDSFIQEYCDNEFVYYDNALINNIDHLFINKDITKKYKNNTTKLFEDYPVFKDFLNSEFNIQNNTINVSIIDNPVFNYSYYKLEKLAKKKACNVSLIDADKGELFFDFNDEIVSKYINSIKKYKSNTIFIPKYNEKTNINSSNYLCMNLLNFDDNDDYDKTKNIIKDLLS